ncbi:MAG: DUF3291 domain-containing protein [Pseudomonadota bacterium]
MPIAHLNWGVLKAPWEDPLVADFVNALDRVNAVAERSPGFLWRMPGEAMEREQTLMHAFGPPERVASSLSVWESAAELDHFVQKTIHGAFMARRDEWFEVLERPQYVLWHVADGHRPTVSEGAARRDTYRARGPSMDAFDFEYARAHGL